MDVEPRPGARREDVLRQQRIEREIQLARIARVFVHARAEQAVNPDIVVVFPFDRRFGEPTNALPQARRCRVSSSSP